VKDQILAAAATLVKVFLAAALGQIIVGGIGVLDLDANGWKGVAAAGLSAVIVTGYNWISPNDTRYGIGAGKAGE